MRHATPYPVLNGPDIVRHRALGGRHAGTHEQAPQARTVNPTALALSAAAVVAAWWVLLAGVGLPAHQPVGPPAPSIQPYRQQILPPLTVKPTNTGPPTRRAPAPPKPAKPTPTRTATPCPTTESRQP